MKAMLCCLLLQLAVGCGSVVKPAGGHADAGPEDAADADVAAPDPDGGPAGAQPCVLGTSTIGNCTI
jgi:hypothetical protein